MNDGIFITDLPEKSEIDGDSLFLMSEHDIYLYDRYNSVKIAYDDLIEDIASAVSAKLGLGSMAFEETSSYTPVQHRHDDRYNLISSFIFPYSKTNSLSIGNFFKDGTITPLYVGNDIFGESDSVSISDVYMPVGDIRFQMIDKLDAVEIQSEDFDGWVYPDGTIYDLSDFILSNRISSIFYVDAGKFAVPVLSDFIKINNGEFAEDRFQKKTGRTVNSRHTHFTTADISGQVEMRAILPIGDIAGEGICIHNGINGTSSKYYETTPGLYPISVHIENLGSDRVFKNTGSTEIAYPSYTNMPVQVFLGKSRWSR